MRLALALTVLFGVLFAGTAEAQKGTRYLAKHPLPPGDGGGFCYIDAPHVHSFAPPDTRLYRVVDDEYYFVGDPVPFGYDGPKFAHFGPHPIIEVHIILKFPVYCYLDGPHYHASEPPEEAAFEYKEDTYWYVGPFEPNFQKERPRYVVINDVYRPLKYERPIVDISMAPPTFKIDVNIRVQSPIVVLPIRHDPHDPHCGCGGHGHHHGHGHGHGHGKHKHKHKH